MAALSSLPSCQMPKAGEVASRGAGKTPQLSALEAETGLQCSCFGHVETMCPCFLTEKNEEVLGCAR